VFQDKDFGFSLTPVYSISDVIGELHGPNGLAVAACALLARVMTAPSSSSRRDRQITPRWSLHMFFNSCAPPYLGAAFFFFLFHRDSLQFALQRILPWNFGTRPIFRACGGEVIVSVVAIS